MKERKQPKFEFTASGFIISIILVAMFSTTFFSFASELESVYNENASTSASFTLQKYNQTDKILQETKNIEAQTTIKEDVSAIDIIGGYFKSGYAALKTAVLSYSLFDDLLDDASNDVEALGIIKTYLYAIILIAMIVGILLTVLVKMRI